MTETDIHENRFAYLLQPIRDLTKNWNIDVAAQLEEYLAELETITISFDEGQTTMNFAEAALLIQGSACVYSKKVEYLYTLVYQMLDLISFKKKQAQASSVNSEGKDKDITFPNENDDAEFLSLDDIKIDKNITLKNNDHNESVKLLLRVPLALIPLEDYEKGDMLLYNKNGEVIANKNDFYINSCYLHQSGTLLLDPKDAENLDNLLNSSSSIPVNHVINKRLMEIPATEKLNNSDIGGGLADVSMDDEDPFDNDLVDNEKSINKIKDAYKDKCMQRSERIKRIFPELGESQWIPIDPHSEDNKEKPFKKGKTFKIPPNLEIGKRKRKITKSVVKKELCSVSQFISQHIFSHSPKFPRNYLKYPVFPELEDLYWAEYKNQQKILKARNVRHIEDDYDDNNVVPDHEGDINDTDDIPLFPGFEDADVEDSGALNFNLSLRKSNAQDKGIVMQTYEDLVRHYVEMYLTNAQEYALVTELSKRVAEWEEKIVPRLEEEERREPFDIHVYGTTVLDAFKDVPNGKWVFFKAIVQAKPSFEVCRLFLATLQLANNYNVEIRSQGNGEGGVDSMELRLLSTKRHYEELAEYQAPSLKS